jgi:hypothetical protein
MRRRRRRGRSDRSEEEVQEEGDDDEEEKQEEEEKHAGEGKCICEMLPVPEPLMKLKWPAEKVENYV